MDKIDEKLLILQPVLGTKKVHKLRQMYYYSDDYREKNEIESHIDLLISRHVKTKVDDQIILPPPPAEKCKGDIEIGTTEYMGSLRDPFSLKLKSINRHLGIFGSTGSGKTTFALNLIRKLHKKGIPFIIFDWEKSYRNLSEEFNDVQVLTVGADVNPLHLNILDVPPGITKEEYVKSLISLFGEDYLSGAGSDTMFLNYLKMTYEEHEKPNFNNLKEIVLREIQKDMKGRGRLSGRSGLWKETVQRIITFLSFGASDSILGSNYHYPLEKLFQQNIVLEFGNIQSPRDRKFIIHCIINWLFLWMQYHGIEAEHLNQCIIFEEFHNITMKSREDNLISLLFRQCRKYGIGLVGIDQTPSEIPNAIFANMNVKVSFTLATSQDISAISKAMNFNPFNSRYFGMLKTGQAIINTKQSHADPFLIRVPFIKSTGNICDQELISKMASFPKYHELDQLLSPDSSEPRPPQDNEILPPMEKLLFTNIIERPLDGVDERTKRLGIHSSIMSKVHCALADKALIKAVTVDLKKLFEVTEYGKTIADNLSIQIPKKQTRGGLEHDYWIAQTVQFLRKQMMEPVCEVDNIDITDIKAGFAIEIETGKSDIKANLLKLKNSNVSSCFMLATNKQAEIKIRKIMDGYAEKYSFIKIMLAKEFQKLTRDQIIPPITLTPKK